MCSIQLPANIIRLLPFIYSVARTVRFSDQDVLRIIKEGSKVETHDIVAQLLKNKLAKEEYDRLKLEEKNDIEVAFRSRVGKTLRRLEKEGRISKEKAMVERGREPGKKYLISAEVWVIYEKSPSNVPVQRQPKLDVFNLLLSLFRREKVKRLSDEKSELKTVLRLSYLGYKIMMLTDYILHLFY